MTHESSAGPKLVVMDAERNEGQPEAPSPEPSRRDDAGTPRSLIWVLGLGLALVGLLLALQVQHSWNLADELQRNQQELGQARATVAIYESRIAEVRDRLGSLAEEILQLEASLAGGEAAEAGGESTNSSAIPTPQP